MLTYVVGGSRRIEMNRSAAGCGWRGGGEARYTPGVGEGKVKERLLQV
jgi:hypothetical protein